MAKKKDDPKKLDAFAWDEAENLDFFGTSKEEEGTKLTDEEKEELKNPTPPVKKEEKPDDKKEINKEKPSEESEEKAEFFKEEKEEVTEVAEVKDEKFFNILAEGLKAKGGLSSIEIPTEELSEEDFIQLNINDVDKKVDETFEAFFEELDDEARSFLKHKKDGGATKDFFQVLQQTSTVPQGDLTDVKFQKSIARYYFKNVEGIDDEDIDDKLTWLEDSDKLEKYAEKYKKKIETQNVAQQKAIEKQRKDALKLAEDNAKTFVKDVKTALKESDKVKDFIITKEDKKELLSYITEPQVKIGKNKFITGLQAGLKSVMSDDKKLILLAKLIKSDFDVSSIETKAETKKVVEIKEKLKRASKTVKPTGQPNKPNRSLSDYF